jgi:predicted nucleotidyltransferase
MKMTYHGVNAAMRHKVQRQLTDVERRYGVRVLYACESGSRGWGFASPDSDYDVRFLYVHPLEWYLRVDAPRDVIELPIDDELDVCGWEWRKALGLLKGANPTLIEWLDSPVVYRQDDATVQALKNSSALVFSGSRPLALLLDGQEKFSRLSARRTRAAEKVLLRTAPAAGRPLG